MRARQALQSILLDIVPNVYFQPPKNIEIIYPCIVYNRDKINTDFSGNLPYNRFRRYSLTVIDPEADSDLVTQVGALPRCVHDRFYTADNLNHDVFTIFF